MSDAADGANNDIEIELTSVGAILVAGHWYEIERDVHEDQSLFVGPARFVRNDAERYADCSRLGVSPMITWGVAVAFVDKDSGKHMTVALGAIQAFLDR